MLGGARLPKGWIVRSAGRLPPILVCLIRGHRWDPAPRADVKMLRCVRCGMTAEPAGGL